MNILSITKLTLLFSIVLFLNSSAYAQNDSLPAAHLQKSVSLKKAYKPEPVLPFQDTLFYICTGIGSFTAHDRAVAVTDRIRNFNKEFGKIQPDSLTIYTDIELIIPNLIPRHSRWQ